MISLLDAEAIMSSPDTLVTVQDAIHLVRGQRIMLDSDLAAIYGVQLRRLNEQVRRNQERFPIDFAFQLTAKEFTNLKSQIATSSSHGGKRKLPWAFTEHGAIMLASVLKSNVAVEASVRVVRAFIQMRELVSANSLLAQKLGELEGKFDKHDHAIAQLFEVIRRLIAPEPSSKKREIGFHVRETAPPYRAMRKA